MNKDWFFLVKSLCWGLTASVCWLYAARGYSAYPRADMWFWGIFFWIDLITVGVAVSSIVAR